MNIIEAIKSGGRFRRKGETSWYSAISDNYPLINISAISRENFLADDWEIDDGTVKITREQFNDAAITVADKLYRPTGWPIHMNDFLGELKKELGL
jgi:hypothetical protein